MTTARTIEMARSFLKAGNATSYAQLMSASIRSAMSDRTAKAIRTAIVEDKAEAHFARLDSNCPVAA